MANEIREANPMLSPDSVRATMNFLHAFNETHTKRFNGYEDTDVRNISEHLKTLVMKSYLNLESYY